MDWKNAVEDIFEKYSGSRSGTATAVDDAHRDFQQVAQTVPSNVVASGISEAFRSNQTPPFAEMLGNLFNNSNSNQRADVLNELVRSVGSGGLASLPGVGGLSSLLRGGNITPEQAQQVSGDQVQRIAAHAEKQNPSVVDRVSGFYAQHPQAMKAAGGIALSIALQHVLQRKQ